MEEINFKDNFKKYLIEGNDEPKSKEDIRRIIRESILEKKAEETETEVDVETEPEMDLGVETTDSPTETSDLEGDARTVQDDLEKALEGAKSMGDEKLINQIENTITFLVRSQHSVTENEDENEPSELNMQFYMALSDLIQEYSDQGLSNGEILYSLDMIKDEWDNMPTDNTKTQIKR